MKKIAITAVSILLCGSLTFASESYRRLSPNEKYLNAVKDASYEEMLQTLNTGGASIAAKNDFGSNALHIAVSQCYFKSNLQANYLQIISYLISQKPSLLKAEVGKSSKKKFGNVFHIVAQYGLATVLDALIENRSNNNKYIRKALKSTDERDLTPAQVAAQALAYAKDKGFKDVANYQYVAETLQKL